MVNNETSEKYCKDRHKTMWNIQCCEAKWEWKSTREANRFHSEYLGSFLTFDMSVHENFLLPQLNIYKRFFVFEQQRKTSKHISN